MNDIAPTFLGLSLQTASGQSVELCLTAGHLSFLVPIGFSVELLSRTPSHLEWSLRYADAEVGRVKCSLQPEHYISLSGLTFRPYRPTTRPVSSPSSPPISGRVAKLWRSLRDIFRIDRS